MVAAARLYLFLSAFILVAYTVRHAIFSTNRLLRRSRHGLQDLFDSSPARVTVLVPMRNEERVADHIVIEHGTVPIDDLYQELRSSSRNDGILDQDALLRGEPQRMNLNPDGRFMLFHVGDAVASRNIHAAIYDSLRLCKDF